MEFDEYIQSLDSDSRKNYEKYQPVRGKQVYYIIYCALEKTSEKFTYKDINSLVIFDKELKDILYKYLGTLEEYIRSCIFSEYDIPEDANVEKPAVSFRLLPELKKISGDTPIITSLYKCYSLSLSETCKVLEKYALNYVPLNDLRSVCKLRNRVMHHQPLLFDFCSKSYANEVGSQIDSLILCLPENYRFGLKKEIKEKLSATKKNLAVDFHHFLITLED